jgi:hypothetical protein
MPGFLDGEAQAILQDAQRLADHLAGIAPLDPAAAVRGDLNGDGRIRATDLLHMLRAANGETELPLEVPAIEPPDVAFLRPGIVFSLFGSYLGEDATALQAVLTQGGNNYDLTVIALEPVLDTDDNPAAQELTLRAPAALAPSEDSDGAGRLTVLRAGVASSAVGVSFIDAPLLDALEREQPGSDALLLLSGEGFGNDVTSVVVHFGDQNLAPNTVAPETITVAPPAGITGSVPLFVAVDDRFSNPLQFTPLGSLSGQLVLPAGSPFQPADLRIVGPQGEQAVPNADGTFSLQTEAHPYGSLEAVDGTGAIILQAYHLWGGDITMSATSTAYALIITAMLDAAASPARLELVLGQILPSLTEATNLATAIEAAHVNLPRLEDQLEADTAVRQAFLAAIQALPAIQQ